MYPVKKEEMKMKYHKHNGVKSRGKLKSHPITQKHKDKTAQKYHNLTQVSSYVQKITYVKIPIKNGYISLNLNTVSCKGIQLSFVRYGKTVGLQIDKR